MKKLLFSIALLSAACSASALDPQVGTGETDGYHLVWQDLFDSGELNFMRWNIEVNGAGGGNNELQYYTDRIENVRVGRDSEDNGCLILTARREGYMGKSFTSGRINSKNLIAFTHGKIEASIKLPTTANGLWPAFWMMGNDYDVVGWPKCGEIDICEFGHADGINAGTSDRYFNGACHWGPSWPQASYAQNITRSYSMQDGRYHLFTLIWNDNEIAMYVDLDDNPVQNPYYRMTIPDNNPTDEWYPGNYFHKPFFILFNLAVGGNFPGIYDAGGITALNDANGQEASMYVNFVKIYQKGVAGEEQYFLDPGDAATAIESVKDSASGAPVAICDGTVMLDNAGTVEVYDLAGRLVDSARGVNTMSLGGLPGGCFVVKATVDGTTPVTLKYCK